MRRDFRIAEQPKIMIIPMIDIMLFVLVFFMVSTIYMVQLNTLPVNLPAAAAAQRETKPNLISITITEQGDVVYDKDTLPVENLAERIRSSLMADSETVFVLRGDRKAFYEDMATVLDALKQSGARHVSIATELKGR
ncbi:ExbD/TolR family protein [Propionispora hippei]|uniref:Biopolymer transport protein ExbD n=1 Tax=Propionispora hippei DSM 15287 TaxID=1123003 RepID=A0A1M6BIZ1_9FIRM|nr:biopolymer transporter ExbD [Propionispora hippei]SHI48694.1 biopolymer transport protein ExbD [Propionispora hippei DSM 15287]